MFLADLNRDRLDQAAEMVKPDATICSGEVDIVEAVMELTDGRGVDVAITAAAAGVTQEQALQYTARQGRISFFGGLPKDNPIIACDSNLVHYRELTIVGANGSSPAHNKQALELISSRCCACRRPDHASTAARSGPRRHSDRGQRGSHQGDHRAVT